MSAVVDEVGTHPLDNPGWGALTGPHRGVAQVYGRAARYLSEVSPFVSLEDNRDEACWQDLAALVGAGQVAVLPGILEPAPVSWEQVFQISGVQLVDTSVAAEPDTEAVRLGLEDVPEMLDLVARTDPGPFRARTVELGTYLGIRHNGALVAMAGERLRPPGWTEVSAVCTDPAYRGRGLGGRLVKAVAAVIRERGDVPFLHTGATNTTAIRLYESLGFTLRRHALFTGVRVPAIQE
ncbi:GNAT family N-acetyltransferase [Fodinicola feengrottensis]|uniref:GNAT family N-acetyltransferase n=1 Tax=Fodinicola feengrottensis TaxID=435914 RepID=A0ABN2I319_9ACTN